MDKTHLPADEAVASLIDTVTTLRHTRTVAAISPDMATRLLATVDLDVSRRMMGASIQRMALAMRDGQWEQQANYADPITITPEGRLRNGKQRLVALILTGATLNFSACIHPEDMDVPQ